MAVRALVATLLLLALGGTAAGQPRVVVSINPVHGLVAAVMQGIAAPDLLLRGTASPHGYALRPSQARLLRDADLIVWVGPDLEGFLDRHLDALGDAAPVLTLMAEPRLRLLPPRSGGLWERGADDHGHAAHGHEQHAADPHLWLDPANAVVIAHAVAARLGRLDPARAAVYRDNAAALEARLARLTRDIDMTVAPVRNRPYVVFHDAYQYFESRFATAAAGSVTVSPERPPGARRLAQIRRRMLDQEIVCLFREPQFEPAMVETLVEGTPVRTGMLDPLGAGIPPGPRSYPTLLRGLAAALVDCLAD